MVTRVLLVLTILVVEILGQVVVKILYQIVRLILLYVVCYGLNLVHLCSIRIERFEAVVTHLLIIFQAMFHLQKLDPIVLVFA